MHIGGIFYAYPLCLTYCILIIGLQNNYALLLNYETDFFQIILFIYRLKSWKSFSVPRSYYKRSFITFLSMKIQSYLSILVAHCAYQLLLIPNVHYQREEMEHLLLLRTCTVQLDCRLLFVMSPDRHKTLLSAATNHVAYFKKFTHHLFYGRKSISLHYNQNFNLFSFFFIYLIQDATFKLPVGLCHIKKEKQ